LIYGIFATLSVKEHKPTLADGINGGWLLSVVSTQSIAAQLDTDRVAQPGLVAAVLGRDERGNLVRKAGIIGIVLAPGEVGGQLRL